MPPLTAIPARTIAKAVHLRGVGLFCAAVCELTMRPAERAGEGLVFRRVDLPGQPVIPVSHRHVIARERQTVLSLGEIRGSTPAPSVQTIEHVLSALAACGVSECVLDVSGPEVPMMDGSAQPFTEAVLKAGVVAVAGAPPCEPIRVREVIDLREGAARIQALPFEAGREPAEPTLAVSYALEFDEGEVIGAQTAYFEVNHARPDTDLYAAQIAPARTFCTEQQARLMAMAKMHAHLQPRDVLVIGAAGPIDNVLRFADEPARHKVLDVIGDLALAGRPIHGRVVAHRSGHALNQRLAAALAG
ncbi:MAG: UDP-3-O-acyl-N-acetylglucosamine deacetylase [Phycisphaerales bacterium]